MFQKHIQVQTRGLYDMVELTDLIQSAIDESKITDGIIFVNSLHNTAALIIQEADPTIHRDLREVLNKWAPLTHRWEHSYEGAVNATAHLKSNLLGSFLTFPLKGGKLVLGTWQRAWLVELFEARRRTVVVTVMGE